MALDSVQILSLLALVGLAVGWASTRSSGGLPPGPSGLPYVGTPLKHVKGARWFLYTEWAKQYGA